MAEIPIELIRQVQIRTRSSAGLPDYNPSDPTLPALPSLSDSIAAAAAQHRCKKCRGELLRGPESIICVFCGLGPHYDVVPDPISFTSTLGYRWLLSSLRLDGSETVDPTNQSAQNQGQRSPKSLTPLSDFLNFKIPWPAETEKQESSFTDKHMEESRSSLSLTGVAPDKFFLKSTKNNLSDMSSERPFMHDQSVTAGIKDVTAVDSQSLFQNVQSSAPADSSPEQKTSEAFSGWEADFQSADSKNKSQDPKSFDHPTGLEVNLAAHIDSVFGPRKDLNDEKSKDNPSVSPGFDDWNSDDVWNNLSSNTSNFSGGVDATMSTKNGPKDDNTFVYSKDSSDDLFQDLQSPTNYTDKTENKTPSEEHKTMDEDLYDEWNDFTGSTSLQFPSQDTWTGGDFQVSTSDQKSSEIDLFSLDKKSEKEEFGSFSQPDLFSISTSNSNALTEVNPVMSESSALDWLVEDSNSPNKSVEVANNENALSKSTEDDVKMLISQMHDLSFMLDTNLHIPSGSEADNSSTKN